MGLSARNGDGYRDLAAHPVDDRPAADVRAAYRAVKPRTGAVEKAGAHAAPARAGLSGIAQRGEDPLRSPPAGRGSESAVPAHP